MQRVGSAKWEVSQGPAELYGGERFVIWLS